MPDPSCQATNGRTDWGAEPEWVEVLSTGMVGQRDYLIRHTRDVGKAAALPDAPRYGQPWSTDLPLLKVTRVRFVQIGGVDESLGGGGGNVWARAEYATPQAGGRLPDVRPGDKYSVIVPSVSSLNRVYDARRELNGGVGSVFDEFEFVPPPDETVVWDGPIKGGRGYQVPVGTTAFEIHTFPMRALTDVLLTRMIRLQRFQMVNNDRVTIPRVLGSEVDYAFEPGQLKYTSYRVGQDRGLYNVVHLVEASPDWFERWVREDEFGDAEGDPIRTVALPAAKLAGLW
jgi:hypothetical protein